MEDLKVEKILKSNFKKVGKRIYKENRVELQGHVEGLFEICNHYAQ